MATGIEINGGGVWNCVPSITVMVPWFYPFRYSNFSFDHTHFSIYCVDYKDTELFCFVNCCAIVCPAGVM